MSRAESASAFADSLPYRPAGQTAFGRAANRVVTVFQAWVNRRKIRTLMEFDEHMLRDIGLSRSDVASALSLPFGEDPSLRLAAVSNEKRVAQRASARLDQMLGQSSRGHYPF